MPAKLERPKARRRTEADDLEAVQGRAARKRLSNQVSDFRYDQPWTLVDNGGHHGRGQARDSPGSLARYLGSGRRGKLSDRRCLVGLYRNKSGGCARLRLRASHRRRH
jgi:hypothetical protein